MRAFHPRMCKNCLWQLLRQSELNMSMGALPTVAPDDLEVTPLIHDDLFSVVRLGHHLMDLRQLKRNNLANVQWMLPGPNVAARRSASKSRRWRSTESKATKREKSSCEIKSLNCSSLVFHGLFLST